MFVFRQLAFDSDDDENVRSRKDDVSTHWMPNDDTKRNRNADPDRFSYFDKECVLHELQHNSSRFFSFFWQISAWLLVCFVII